MRLDKYLKLTRLIKRRGVAKVLIDEGSIQVNNKTVKPSYDVKKNDIIKLKLGRRIIEIKVNELLETSTKETADKMYIVIKEELSKE